VLNAMLAADPIEGMAAEASGWVEAVAGLVGKGDAPDRVRGRPLSVRIAWIAEENAATTLRRKAAPVIMLAAE